MIHEKGDTLNDAIAITPRINKTVDRRMPNLRNYKKKQYSIHIKWLRTMLFSTWIISLKVVGIGQQINPYIMRTFANKMLKSLGATSLQTIEIMILWWERNESFCCQMLWLIRLIKCSIYHICCKFLNDDLLINVNCSSSVVVNNDGFMRFTWSTLIYQMFCTNCWNG